MQNKLTLSEIAAIYKVSPKTFRKEVKKKNIPHERIGREMRFVLARVEACLSAQPPLPKSTTARVSVRRPKVSSLFAERVGI